MHNCLFRRLFAFFILCILSTNVYSKNAVLSGEIANLQNEKIYLYSGYNESVFTEIIDSTTTGNDGYFKFNINKTIGPFYTIEYQDRQVVNVILFKADSLYIKINRDGDYFELINFNGEGAFLNKFYADLSNSTAILSNMDSIVTYSPQKYQQLLETWKQKEQDSLSALIKMKHISLYAYNLMNIYIRNNYFSYHYYYGNMNSYPSLDQNFYTFEKDIKFTDSIEYIGLYEPLLYAFVCDKYQREKKNPQSPIYQKQKYSGSFEIIKRYLTGICRDYALYNLAHDDFWMQNYNDYFASIYKMKDFLNSTYTNKKIANLFNEGIKYSLEYAPGTVMKDFPMKDTTGKQYWLSDFKDKIIYIDFWYTGCGSCINAIPKHNALYEKYKNNNIVFLNLSIDGEKFINSWKKTVSAKNLEGFNVNCSKKEFEKYTQLFFTCPRYMILGKGNILKTVFAPPVNAEEDLIKIIEEENK
jgi:thiol-disulfide isomerase/thioredoxin